MEPIVLQFELPSLSEQRVTEPRNRAITLYSNRLEYKLSMVCEEQDEKMGIWQKGIEQDDEVAYAKSIIVGVAVSWDHTEQLWKLIIYQQGVKDIVFWFSDELVCRQIAKEIRVWIFS